MQLFSKSIVFLVQILTLFSSTFANETLKELGIYSFLNRHDKQYLTGINLKIPNPVIVLDDWRAASTQKWRAVGAYTITAYQLKPTSDESRVMNVDWQSHGKMVSQSKQNAGYGFFGLSNSEYWQVKSAGEGYSQVKNYKTGTCLQSLGMGKQVGLSECDNSFRQQWEIHLI